MPVEAYAAPSARAKLEPFHFVGGPLGPHEVKIRVTCCGVCQNDLAMIDNDWGLSEYPLVAGHEIVGTVAAIGQDVDGLPVGQRVGVGWQCGSCAECEYCARGEEHLCAKEERTIVEHCGGWANSVRAEARFALPIPEAIPSVEAAPLLCAGSTVFAPILHHRVTAQMKTAVVGFGGPGHLAVQFLAKSGCEVTAMSPTRNEAADARKLGAAHFIATEGTSELENAPHTFDFILYTAAAPLAWEQYLRALRPGGTLVLCGLPDAQLKFSVSQLTSEKRIAGARCGSPSDMARMLAFAARTGVRPMIETFPMREINAAVEHARAGKARYCIVLEA